MSHFTVAVFTKPNGGNVDELLNPFQEVESTGNVVEFGEDVDLLEEAQKTYKSYDLKKIRSISDGKLYDLSEDRFYREPTEEEKKIMGPAPGSGAGNGLSWWSKDWSDGKGYRAKVYNIPEGYQEVKVEMSFREFVGYYYRKEFLGENEDPDIYGKHQWGWMRINSKGEVIELVRRTNPKSKWDWYEAGGRWGGSLLIKSELTQGYPKAWNCDGKEAIEGYAWTDSAKIKDICWDKMYEEARKDREKIWDEAHEEIEKDPIRANFLYGIKPNTTKEEYINQPFGFSTFAVVTPDGKWYEKGEMGWWCIVDDEETAWDEKYKERFLDTADPEWTITVVDCHI